LDHQSVGLIAREIEAAAIPTVYLGSCRFMMSQVKPPRSAFINFPLGRQCGRPHDVDLQTRILRDALSVLVTARDPGNIVDLQYEWHEPFDFPGFLRDMQDMLREEESALQEWKPK
jgi:hypothetical protein